MPSQDSPRCTRAFSTRRNRVRSSVGHALHSANDSNGVSSEAAGQSEITSSGNRDRDRTASLIVIISSNGDDRSLRLFGIAQRAEIRISSGNCHFTRTHPLPFMPHCAARDPTRILKKYSNMKAEWVNTFQISRARDDSLRFFMDSSCCSSYCNVLLRHCRYLRHEHEIHW